MLGPRFCLVAACVLAEVPAAEGPVLIFSPPSPPLHLHSSPPVSPPCPHPVRGLLLLLLLLQGPQPLDSAGLPSDS